MKQKARPRKTRKEKERAEIRRLEREIAELDDLLAKLENEKANEERKEERWLRADAVLKSVALVGCCVGAGIFAGNLIGVLANQINADFSLKLSAIATSALACSGISYAISTKVEKVHVKAGKNYLNKDDETRNAKLKKSAIENELYMCR